MSREWTIKGGESEAGVSSLGGTITQFQVKGRDIFFPQQEVEGKARGGCHWCAPWFGPASRRGGDRKHGFLRDMEAPRSQLIKSDFVALSYGPRVEDGRYPWLLEYKTWAMLRENGTKLELGLTMERTQDEVSEQAPVNPGLHPYFACGDQGEAVVNIGGSMFRDFSESSHTLSLPPLDLSDSLSVQLARDVVLMMTLDFRQGEKRPSLPPQLVLWSDDAKRYVCAEPVFSPRSQFDTPQGIGLEVGDRISMVVSFRALVG